MGSAAGKPQDHPVERSGGSDLGVTASPALAVTIDCGGGGRIPTLLIPLGATEQHGPHLPLATDTIIAAAWAEAAAVRIDGAMVAPALPYGSSGEHRDFTGTISIGQDALRLVIVELVRSVASYCDKVVLVSGHGGNVPVLKSTVGQLADEGHIVSWVVPRWPSNIGVDAHGGHTETSLMLHLRPQLVGPFTGVVGNTAPLAELMPTLATDGLAAVTENGVLGDPTGATAEHGAELFDYLVDSLVAHVNSAA